jgi:dTDP-4-dehydrorhamnose reductase
MVERATKVLVVGASGMLGHAVVDVFAHSPGYQTWGTLRSDKARASLPTAVQERILADVDAQDDSALHRVFQQVRPDVVVNCVGVVKQLAAADDPLESIPLNSLLPHRLARHCARVGSRLVHVSTDCVFTGSSGNYREEDTADARDLYGRSKLLGEVDEPHAITLRTSIIGEELVGAHGLVGWFLSQKGSVKGFVHAIFSGLPTVTLARLIRDHVLRLPDLRGLYHVSAAAISKYDLLCLVGAAFDHGIEIVPDDKLKIDRSLDSTRFRRATGWQPPEWSQLIREMREARRDP